MLCVRMTRRLAICLTLCVLVPLLAPAVASACEGGESLELNLKQGESKGKNCTFTKVGDTCDAELANNTPAKFEIIEGKFLKPGAAGRYAKTVEGCKKGKKKFVKPETCLDLVEATKIEAGTENEYCIVYKNEAGGAAQEVCGSLKM